ncbi:kinase-like domain-containing protein [Fusarium tricinctum]|uniref:Kinase-like domain-containing protein n=1 Tax=Fusarium tricinctum TaxID=61284 RepID=A0A8K0W722_9HYPO|nr:kinase-like domain-containing protein [Fusarium tricinctum]
MTKGEYTDSSICSTARENFVIYSQSSFFREDRSAALPSPTEIKALNEASGDVRAKNLDRPAPVKFPIFGVGSQVWNRRDHCRDRDAGPCPRDLRVRKDGDQRFLYMALIEGDSLQARFHALSETERQAICKELRSMVNAWRTLKQSKDFQYSVIARPGRAGPYLGANSVRKFHDACGIEIEEDIPICFTHNDLCPPNILISKGPAPKVMGIIDWEQAGWYPSYWEYCKARRVSIIDENFGHAHQEEWTSNYLPLIFDDVDEERVYHPWLYFTLSCI